MPQLSPLPEMPDLTKVDSLTQLTISIYDWLNQSWAWLNSSAHSAGSNSPVSYLTVKDEAALPQSRYLVAGTGIALTDGGPGTTLTISATGSVTSVVGEPGKLQADRTNGTVTLSLIGPYTPATYTVHGVLLGQGTSSITALTPGASNALLASRGASLDPIWNSTPTVSSISVTCPISTNPAYGDVVANGNPFIQSTVANLLSYANVVLADNPAGYWRLGEASGGFSDSSGNANNATVTWGSYTYGVAGAIVDDSDNAVIAALHSTATVAASASLPSGDTFSVEGWFKRSTTQSVVGGQVFIAQKVTGFQVYINASNQLQANVVGGLPWFTAATAPVITDTTTWHHFCFTKNGAARAGYLDGVALSNTQANVTVAPADSTIYLTNNSSNNQGADQSVDELAVYDYVLTPAQVLAHYNEGHALKNGRVAYATDGTVGTDPVIGGGSGTMVQYVRGHWVSSAAGAGVTSITGTANQIAASSSTGAVTLSLIGPYTPATYTVHGVLLGQGTSSITSLTPGPSGYILTSQGAGLDPIWTAPVVGGGGISSVAGTTNQIQAVTVSGAVTLSLVGPYTPATFAVHGVLLGQGTSSITSLTPGASGYVLTSQGASLDPVWAVTIASVTGTANQILASTAAGAVTLSLIGPYTPATFGAHGVLLGQGTSSITSLTPGTSGYVLTSQGAGLDPVWSATSLTGAITSVTGTANQINASTVSGAVTLSLIGPYTPATYAAHGVLLGQGTSSITASTPGASGTVFTSQGATSDPIWSALPANVSSIAGTTNQITASASTGAVTLSLAGPHNFTTQAVHGVLLGQGTGAITAVAPGTSGWVLTAQGPSSDPIWAVTSLTGAITAVNGTANQIFSSTTSGVVTLSLIGPYTPATYAAHGVLIGEGTSSIISVTPGGSGTVLTSQGVSLDPIWSALPANVSSITGTVNQIAASASTGAVTLSLIGPYAPATYTAHGVLLGEGTSSIVSLTPGAVGGILVAQGAAADPSWLADVDTGQLLASGGVGVLPAYTATPVVTKLTVAYQITANPSYGDVMANGNPVTQTTVASLLSYPNVILGDSPGGFWRLGEASGNFADSSGHGLTATASGTITYGAAGAIVDGATTAVLASTNSLGTVAANASLPGGDVFSIEVWFKRSATQGVNQVFVAQKTNGFYCYFGAGNVITGGQVGGGNWFTHTTTTVDTTTWHHAVLTKNGATRAGYLDGVALTNTAGNLTIAPADSTLYLLSNNGVQGANQNVDEIAVYTTALTAAQVLAHYNEGRALKNGRVAYATDATPATNPVTGGGTGSLVQYAAGRWSSSAFPALTQGDLLVATAANTVGSLADVAAGSYLRSGGVGAIPVWSTVTLPNAVAAGDLLIGTATNVVGSLADVAAGQLLTSGGAGNPSWTGTPTLGIAGTTTGSLALTTSTASSGTVTLQSAAASYTNYTLTFPAGAPAQGALLAFSNATGALTGLADVAAGSYLRSGGVSTLPVWSTLTLPNAATTGDVLIATSTNTVGSLADVAAGSYLRSGGVGAAPVWSTMTLPNAVTTGDLLIGTGTNAVGSLADVAVGQNLISGGVGVAPSWSPTLFLSGTSLGINELALQSIGVATGATIEAFGGASYGALSLATSSVANNTAVGILMLSTTGTAQVDKRIAQISATMNADNTSTTSGYLRFWTADGAAVTEKLRIGTSTPPASPSGWLHMTNGTANVLSFSTTGLAVPGANSVGQKIQLYGSPGTVATTDFALGVQSGAMWFNTGGSAPINFYQNSLAGSYQGNRLNGPFWHGGQATGDLLAMGRNIGNYTVANLPSYSQVVLSTTPGAYWRLDEASGNFTDSSGNANTGTANGTITYGATTGLVHDNNYAITLDGTTAYITVATSATLPNADTFTLNFLVKRTATQGVKQYILCQKTGGFGVYFDTDNTIAIEKVGTGQIAKSTTTFTSTAAYSYIQIIKNGAASCQIISGVTDVTGTVTNQTIAPADAALWLGTSSSVANFFPGTLDEVAVWNTAQTLSQVLARALEQSALKLGRIAWASDGAPTNPITGGGSGCFAVYNRFGAVTAGHPNCYAWQGHIPFSSNRYGTDYTIGDIFYASAAGTISSLAPVATGSVLASAGTANAPVWSATPTLTSLTLSRQLTGTISALTYGATVTPNANNGLIQTIAANNSTAFTIANPSAAYATGTIWILHLNNTSAGALGAITWGTSYKQGTVTAPAAGKGRIFAFYYDGTSNWKLFETADDL